MTVYRNALIQAGRYLNYDSHHPVHVKRGVVNCFYDRAHRLVVTCDDDLKCEEKYLSVGINGYPHTFTFNASKESNPNKENKEVANGNNSLKGLSEDVQRVCRNYGISPVEQRSKVVYKVPCKCILEKL